VAQPPNAITLRKSSSATRALVRPRAANLCIASPPGVLPIIRSTAAWPARRRVLGGRKPQHSIAPRRPGTPVQKATHRRCPHHNASGVRVTCRGTKPAEFRAFEAADWHLQGMRFLGNPRHVRPAANMGRKFLRDASRGRCAAQAYALLARSCARDIPSDPDGPRCRRCTTMMYAHFSTAKRKAERARYPA